MKLIENIVSRAGELTSLRRDFHAYPELSFEEFRTSDVVANLLGSWGIPVHRGLGGTGVVGRITGKGAGRSIGLRADMDALPMQELNAFPHSSKNAGKMHACGHDGHMTMLLGAAQYLSESRDFPGTVHVIFQPAEEFGGGANRMIQDGLFDMFPVDAVFGMHNLPGAEVGTFLSSPGPVMASSNEFKITIVGRGGHAGMPYLAIDPIVVASQMIQMFQNIISRDKKPIDAAVISVTIVRAGDATNVLPETCELQGTVRAFQPAVLDMIERRMREVAEHASAAFGATCKFEFFRNYPAVHNHPDETEIVRRVIATVVSDENLLAQEPTMGAEDFAYMLLKKPGSYCFIGNGDGSHREPGFGPGPCLVHNTSYDFNDALLPLGATYWVRLAQHYLNASAA